MANLLYTPRKEHLCKTEEKKANKTVYVLSNQAGTPSLQKTDLKTYQSKDARDQSLLPGVVTGTECGCYEVLAPGMEVNRYGRMPIDYVI